MPFYYPNWINDFWRIMGLIHFGDKDHFCILREKRFDEVAIREFCTREGLAFYDTACEVRRLKDNASDAFLEVVTATDITSLLLKIPNCNTLVTTGQKATEIIAQTFHCSVPPVGSNIDLAIPIPDQSSSPNTLSDSGSLPSNGAIPDSGSLPSNGAISDSGRASRNIRFWRMPSTSRAYPLPLAQKAAAYRKLFFGDTIR